MLNVRIYVIAAIKQISHLHHVCVLLCKSANSKRNLQLLVLYFARELKRIAIKCARVFYSLVYARKNEETCDGNCNPNNNESRELSFQIEIYKRFSSDFHHLREVLMRALYILIQNGLMARFSL
jgi:hypothetical protein